MNCIVERRRRHRELASQLEPVTHIAAVDVLMPTESPSGHLETELLARKTMYGGIPNKLLRAVIDADLTIVAVTTANNPDYCHVIIR